ncbi:N-acetylmuramoyl-L-alanine amidase [Paenibacillus sp. LjRoot153]|uniref:N-acetylmuramoyl-L-alanine amidase family protein n=1 Tax=Paenibacillus sp. LjRoot153 TaxID=3342270 RepID=UPI003ED0F757
MKNNRILAFTAISTLISGFIVYNVQASSLFKNEIAQSATKIAAHSVTNNSMKKENRILEGKTIVIDAGHGGKDVGATGQTGIHEKELTLQTALNIKQELAEKTGANIVLTREQDEFLTLAERVEIAEKNAADLFISIHFDAFTSNDVAGITTYYNKPADRQLASLIHEEIFEQNIDTRDRGVAQGDYRVLRDNQSPSLLLELGYISNREDEQRIQTQDFQNKAAAAITEGIISYLS